MRGRGRRTDGPGAEPGGDLRPEAGAGPIDLAIGMGKVFRPWIVGLLLVGVFVGIMLWGANRPADPAFVDATAGGSTTTSGLTYEERRILVGDRCLLVQVADTPEKRAQGLKNRESLGEFHGMLFAFAQTQSTEAAFTMSEVRIPLTIGFYDEAGTRVDALDMEPCPDGGADCPVYRSKAPFKNALEVAQGQLPEGPLVGACPA